VLHLKNYMTYSDIRKGLCNESCQANLSLMYMKPNLSFSQILRMAHQFFNTICCTGSQTYFSSPRSSTDHGLSYCYMPVTKMYSLISGTTVKTLYATLINLNRNQKLPSFLASILNWKSHIQFLN
jgi:hypothetical protein